MNKLLVGIAAVSMMLSASAIAQNTSTESKKPDAPLTSAPAAQKSDSGQNTRTNRQEGSQSNGDRNRSANDRGDRRNRSGSERSERAERRGVSTRLNVRIGDNDRDYRRHRRGYRTEFRFGHRHCRNIVVKTRHQHRVVVRHIRRCS